MNTKYIFKTLSYLKGYWIKIILLFFITIVLMCLNLIPIEIFKRLIDDVIPAKDLQLVLYMVAIILGTHFLMLIISYFQNLMLTKIEYDVNRSIMVDFYKHLEHNPLKLNDGQMMERIIDDVNEVTGSTFDLIISPILEIIGIFIVLIYMYVVSPHLTFLAVIISPLFILIILPVNKIIRKKYAHIKKEYAKIFGIIQDKISLISQGKYTVRASKSLDGSIKKYNDVQYSYDKFSLKLNSFISILSEIGPYSILVYATYLIIQGVFDVGTFIAFSMLVPKLFGPVKGLAHKQIEIQTLLVTSERVYSTYTKK